MKDDIAILCGDILPLGDVYDDGYEFCCTLEAGHDGPHRDEFEHDGKSIIVTWHADDDDAIIADDERPPLVRQPEAL